MTRQEHIQWCKDRALEYVERGLLGEAVASMLSDLKKHDETREHAAIPLTMDLMMSGHLATPEDVRRHIEGFN